MKSLYILLLAIVTTVVSCRTKDGEPGPAGESTLTQQGYVTGNITFVDDSGTTINKTFKYEYYESLSENRFYVFENGASSNYEIILNRRSAGDSYNYFNFRIVGYRDVLDGTAEDPFYYEQDNFGFVTVSNGTVYEFNSYDTDITNVRLDKNNRKINI